jgi:NTE family protein
MRAATARVGLVSPRSTWESIGADTPERVARSRRERSIASRRARTRGPTVEMEGSAASAIRSYVITYAEGADTLLGSMSAPAFQRPDILVAGAGGTLGEAWMTGLLAGAESVAGVAFAECEYFVGTSAGAIVAARLAAGHAPRAPRERAKTPTEPAAPRRRGRVRRATRSAVRAPVRWGAALTAPVVPLALASGAPAGARVRAALLARLPSARESLGRLEGDLEELGSRFDGRLRVVCVERRSGRRVVFGAPGQPVPPVHRAVVASCAVPWVFPPVWIGGREYVDGGVWSLTNLDVAPAGRGMDVLCLMPTGNVAASRSSAWGPVRAAARAAAAVEALAVRGRGARVRIVVPDDGSGEAMGTDLMDPRPRERVLAAGWRQGRALPGG